MKKALSTLSALATLAFVSHSSVQADVIIVRGQDSSPAIMYRGTLSAIGGARVKLETIDGSVYELASRDIVEIRHDTRDVTPSEEEARGQMIPEESSNELVPIEDPDGEAVDVGNETTGEHSSSETNPGESTPDELTPPLVDGGDTPKTQSEPLLQDYAIIDALPANEGLTVDTPIEGISYTEGTGEGVIGLWPLHHGAMWAFEEDDTRTELSIIQTQYESERNTYTRLVHAADADVARFSKHKVVVQRKGGRSFFMLEHGDEEPSILLVEPARVGASWDAQNGYEYVVTSINANLTVKDGTRLENCVEIHMRRKGSTKVIAAYPRFFAPGIGPVDKQFVSFTPAKK